MSAVLGDNESGTAVAWRDWLPVLAGLMVLYAPSFYSLAGWYWQTDEGAHGPLLLLIIVWLIWRKRSALFKVARSHATASGGGLLLGGLLLYVLGRSQDIALFEFFALVPILAGSLLAMRGWQALRELWFPILFVAFLVPLPQTFVDALTSPLKQHVSMLAEQVLYTAGYPVARSGVLLVMGQYQLLVADACAGLHSMFSLSALGLLFMYLTSRASMLHNGIMLASILPVAFLANAVRVLLLMLITYHFGDEVGQGVLHNATGILLLVLALGTLMLLDAVLARAIRR